MWQKCGWLGSVLDGLEEVLEVALKVFHPLAVAKSVFESVTPEIAHTLTNPQKGHHLWRKNQNNYSKKKTHNPKKTEKPKKKPQKNPKRTSPLAQEPKQTHLYRHTLCTHCDDYPL